MKKVLIGRQGGAGPANRCRGGAQVRRRLKSCGSRVAEARLLLDWHLTPCQFSKSGKTGNKVVP